LQRYGSAVWSGDISSTWTAFAKQIPAGLNLSLSGIPYWTTDSGGYWPPPRFADRNAKPEDVAEWRELNVRWFQFATFCPLTRLHGDLLPREPWEFGGEDSPAYRAIAKMDRLRYRMLPYIYSLAHLVTVQGGVFMRPLVMDFPNDALARTTADQFLLGKNLMVAPVTRPGERTRPVYLPKGPVWYDFWTGQKAENGTVKAEAPYDSLPLYIGSGSILPFGPDLQYALEKPWDPILLYVYAGSDGSFTLYEDDGETTAYTRGECSEIPITWNNAERRLTLGTRRGSFIGMRKRRTFGVVMVTKDKPSGYAFDRKADKKVSYDGREINIEFKIGR
jgi:alpha-D-xyloside xylohydrolase